MRERVRTQRPGGAPERRAPERAPLAPERGERLDPAARAFMEPRFGFDFSSVRIYSDEQAARMAAEAGAEALTVGQDVVFGAGRYAPDTHRGRLLLAHELTHVVQNERAATSVDPETVSDPGDAAEREASSAARRVAAGETVSVEAAPSAGVSRGVLDWLEENVVDPVGGVASDVGSAVADVGSTIYGGMKAGAGYVREGVSYADEGIDWLEEQAAAPAHWLADKAEGIPVLEQLADAGAWAVDQQAQLTGGALKGATTLLGGVGQMVVNPVDTLIGLEAMAEHVRPIPGMPNPLQVIHGLYNAATTDATLADEMNRTLNPLETMKGDVQFGEALIGGLLEPYGESWEKGKYSEVAGRAIFDIGSLFIGAGEANAAIKGAEGAAIVSEVARGAEVANVVSDVARGAEAANVISDVARGAEAANVVSDVARGAEAANVVSDVARGVEAADAVSDVARGTEAANLASDAARGTEAASTAGDAVRALDEVDHARIADEVAREGRATRVKDIREAAREVKGQELAELRESGLVNDEFVELADDIGLDRAEALAEGKIGLKEAGAEVSHEPFPLAEAPEFGDVPENLRTRGKAGHREGIHGRQFNKGSEYQPVDPRYAEHQPLQPVRERGRTPLSPGEIDEAAEAGAVERWADQQRAIDELIDRSRDPEALVEALEGGKGPGKGRGGPRLSEEERLAREQADLDRGIRGQYRGGDAPEWMRQGAPGLVDQKWAEAMEWMKRMFGGD